MALTLKAMIVTSDGKSFDNVEAAKEHELFTFIEKEMERTQVSVEDMSSFIAAKIERINEILSQKPKKAGKGKVTRRPRKAASETKADSDATKEPEAATEPAKTETSKPKRARAVVAETQTDPSYPGVRIESSSKHRD